MGIVTKAKIFRKRGGALGADPGDVDGFVREVSESAIVHIGAAFRRADLTAAGKPLGARGTPPWILIRPSNDEPEDELVVEVQALDSASTWFEETWIITSDEDTQARWDDLEEQLPDAMDKRLRQRLHDAVLFGGDPLTARYAWIARQFVRGATGQGALAHHGGTLTEDEGGVDSPEARLGLDVWRIGRNVAAEVDGMKWWHVGATITVDDVRRRVLESVRTRLNWPRLPENYDPPPPSDWPEDD